MLRDRADATIVSSDECTVAKKNFDQQLKQAVKARATALLQQSKQSSAGGKGGVKHALVGYDKNVPQASGLAKLIKVLRPAADEVAKASGGAVTL